MTQVLLAAAVLAALGLTAGLLLAVASAVMAVPKDEKIEELLEMLPGINCGACGFSGCEGYAKAMAKGAAEPGLCSPGGAEVLRATAAALGKEAGDLNVRVAVIRCGGNDETARRAAEYRGPKTCASAAGFFGGDLACKFGCLGYGDCAAACKYDAIVTENGLARIDPTKCVGCTACVSACPKNIISMVPGETRGVVRCSNREKGAQTRKVCSVGCIGCMKCVKVCDYDAIHVENFLARIDPEKCTGCGACAKNCPTECITVFGVKHAKTDPIA